MLSIMKSYALFHPLRTVLLLSMVALWTTAASAQSEGPLEWDEKTQSFEAEFGQEKVEATYHFTNTSEETVSIVKTSASCGCTVPTLDKKTYLPGESGELIAIFTIGSRQGEQRKAIEVVTETAGEHATYQLTLEVDIPVPVSLKPRVRFWNLGGESSTEEVSIVLHEDMPMKIEGVSRKDENDPHNFDYQIETIEEGREYLLKITPKSVSDRARAVLYLTSKDDRKDLLRSFPIYAYVR